MADKKYSTRTEYRKIRRQFVKDCILLLCDMLEMKEQDLEQIHLPFFKKLKKTIQTRQFEQNRKSEFY